jgi:hypothetical protein
MGRFNSSTTRVVPVFDQLFDRDPTGKDWLPYLLRAGSRAEEAGTFSPPGLLIQGHRRSWGKNERRLAPPRSLLEWLVDNITEEQVEKSGDKEPARSRRLALARRQTTAIAAAMNGLESGNWRRQWYTLEGESAPDAFLETNNIVLVVEGKRTESYCTTKTKWMPRRSQLLRHMDAATEIAGERQVYGLLLVEGAEPNPLNLSEYWRREAGAQVGRDLLEQSLPHRSPGARKTLAENVLGALTWQRVCSDLKISWPPRRSAV